VLPSLDSEREQALCHSVDFVAILPKIQAQVDAELRVTVDEGFLFRLSFGLTIEQVANG
jgi:hypothetical protein